MAYASVTELFQAIEGEGTPSETEAAVMQAWLDAASNAIDVAMNHPDGFEASEVAEVRYFMGNGRPILDIHECIEVTLVEVRTSARGAFEAWRTPTAPLAGDGDWFLLPLDAPALGFPYTQLCIDPNGAYSAFTKADLLPTVRVTAKWGFSRTPPPLIRQICLAQAGRWYREGAGGFSGTVAAPDTGELRYTRSLRAEFVQVLKDAGYWNPPI